MIGRITLEQIDIRQLWNMVRKHWIILLALPLIPLLLIGVINFMTMNPYYQTAATVIIERRAPEPALAEDQVIANSVLQQHLQNYAQLAQSQTVAKNVIKKLNLPLTVEKLVKMITVSQVNTTDILKIQVNHIDPALAAAIANSTAEELSKAVVADKLSIVNQAQIPDKPVPESKAKNMVAAFLVGLIASLSLVFLLVYLDNTVKTPSDVKAYLKIPLLGMIANYDRGSQHKQGSAHSLMTLEQTNSPISESYRSIRTNVEFASVDSVSQRILITSAGLHEGKSLTVANLAVSMAQAGKSVLIVDADLRNPTQHTLLGLDNGPGLAKALVEDQDYSQYIQKTAVPGLMVLTGGVSPSNPAELLGTGRMKQLLQEVSGQYDRVLIDTPPVGAVTDAAILAQEVEGVILVVASGEVNKEAAQQAIEQLGNVDAKILGVVLNKVL